MTTNMNVFILIPGQIDSKSLYKELEHYHVNVTDLGKKTLVYATVNITEPFIEYIIQACYKYSITGNIEVDLERVVNKKPPE